MTKKRGNGEGSVFMRKTCIECKKIITSGDAKDLKTCKHCGTKLPNEATWEARASVGHDPATGKALRPSFYGKTKKEVLDQLAQALHEVRTGTYIRPTQITLGEWMAKWLTVYKKGQIAQSTYENYQIMIETHIKPQLGNMPLMKLQVNTLQAFYNEKLEHGRVDGKGGLSTKMVRYIHTLIRQALAQALKESFLSRNVADATSPPTIRNKQFKPIEESELIAFLENKEVKDDRLYAAYVLVATTGLRRGELLGLCWDCVALEQENITVKRQLLTLKDGLKLADSTKSKSGRRNIALTDDAVRELKAHKRRQAEERLHIGGAYQDNGLVFCKADGTAIDPREFTKRFQKRMVDAGLPKTRLHDMRHLHATLLLKRGIPAKLVQERLGHSSIQMTLDLYSHVTPEMKRLAAESLNGLLNKEKSSVKAQSE